MNLQKKADELFRRFDNDEIYTVRDLVLRSLEEGICIGLDNAVEIVKDINFPHGETNHLVVLRKVERALLAGKERDGSLIGAGKPELCKPSIPVDKNVSPETSKETLWVAITSLSAKTKIHVSFMNTKRDVTNVTLSSRGKTLGMWTA